MGPLPPLPIPAGAIIGAANGTNGTSPSPGPGAAGIIPPGGPILPPGAIKPPGTFHLCVGGGNVAWVFWGTLVWLRAYCGGCDPATLSAVKSLVLGKWHGACTAVEFKPMVLAPVQDQAQQALSPLAALSSPQEGQSSHQVHVCVVGECASMCAWGAGIVRWAVLRDSVCARDVGGPIQRSVERHSLQELV
jgi:hypothetical protein